MQTDKDYRFEVSLSNDGYKDKVISGAMIGTTKDENNRKIRKQYGFKANSGIGFKRVEVNAEELLEELLSGKVFCHLFNPQNIRKDGTFGSSEKKDVNFAGSYVIGVDIDETSYENVEEFVKVLSLKPTFYYTSYSNMQMREDGTSKGARFRLIYVFEDEIKNAYFFRYCADNLNRQIEKDTQELIEDDCNLRCAQYFNGTNKDNPEITLSYGITNNIYSWDDINVTEEGFVNFCKEYAHYKTVSISRTSELGYILKTITGQTYILDNSTKYFTLDTTTGNYLEVETEDNEGEIVKESYCTKSLVHALKTLSYDDFMKYNRHKYNYSYRVEYGNDWIDDTYQYIDSKYFSLYYPVEKVKDGNKRRKKLFERMCLRRVMNPKIDADTLLFCAYEDRQRFFEIDDDLTIDCLVKNVDVAMDMSIEEIETTYSKNLAYLRSKAPKSGIILKREIAMEVAERNRKLKELRWKLIEDYYDPELNVKENLANISFYLYKITERTLYRFLKARGEKTDSHKLTYEELISLLDVNLGWKKNAALLRDKGYKVTDKRIRDILRYKKNLLCP